MEGMAGTGAGMGKQTGQRGDQAERGGGQDPGQAQIVQRQCFHEGQRHAWACSVHSTLDSSAPAAAARLTRSGTCGITSAIRISTSVGGYTTSSTGRGDSHDTIQTKVGHHSAEHADHNNEYLIGHLAAAQLRKVSGGGAGQRYGGGHAGKAHYHA